MRPFACVSISMRCGSCTHGSNMPPTNSGQRCRIRTNDSPRWRNAAVTIWNRLSGIQSTACATNDAFFTPSVTVSGLIASRYEPRGVVLLLVPSGEVGEACFLVRP